jgi:hypothetical protein
MTIGLGPRGGGVLRLVKPGVYLHFCQGCNAGHTFDVHDVSKNGHVVGFDGDTRAPSLGEPLRHEKDGVVCEYILRGGVMYFTSDCTHALRNQARSLMEYPLP